MKNDGSSTGTKGLVFDVVRAKEAVRQIYGMVRAMQMLGYSDYKGVGKEMEEIVKYALDKLDSVFDEVMTGKAEKKESGSERMWGKRSSREIREVLREMTKKLMEVEAETQALKEDIQKIGEKEKHTEKENKEDETQVVRMAREEMRYTIDSSTYQALGIDETFIEAVKIPLGWTNGPAPKKPVAVLMAMKKWFNGKATKEQIAQALGVYPSAIERAIARLMETGNVVYRNGMYVISERARKVLEAYL